MLYTEYVGIRSIALHKIGNKTKEELIHFSKSTLKTGEEINQLLLHYFLSPFKQKEFYNFYHDVDIKFNEVFAYVSIIFDNPEDFYEQSVNLAKHLYEKSVHPKVKAGEFYVVYFNDCIIEGETVDAVGLFKSENKETFLKVFPDGDNYGIDSQEGLNINKLDKGCIIYNLEKEKGYLVSVVDNQNKSTEAQYWIDDFLHVDQRKDEYYYTNKTLSMCKNFVTQKLPQDFEITKADQVDILNKSIKFFKEKDSFDIDEFANEVIKEPKIIESFKSFKNDFEVSGDISILNNFDISEAAVKKQARILKSVIKLDKNFHIYVHGNREFIHKGYDSETGMHFYQLFFKEEN